VHKNRPFHGLGSFYNRVDGPSSGCPRVEKSLDRSTSFM
jgi:hypothetical protein